MKIFRAAHLEIVRTGEIAELKFEAENSNEVIVVEIPVSALSAESKMAKSTVKKGGDPANG